MDVDTLGDEPSQTLLSIPLGCDIVLLSQKNAPPPAMLLPAKLKLFTTTFEEVKYKAELAELGQTLPVKVQLEKEACGQLVK